LGALTYQIIASVAMDDLASDLPRDLDKIASRIQNQGYAEAIRKWSASSASRRRWAARSPGARLNSHVAIGGGVTMPVSERLRGRFEVSDTLIRFKDPAIRDGRLVTAFTSHHLQVNAGLGFRF
jgi:hypothetical protein